MNLPTPEKKDEDNGNVMVDTDVVVTDFVVIPGSNDCLDRKVSNKSVATVDT